MKVRNRGIPQWLVLCIVIAAAGLVLASCGGGGDNGNGGNGNGNGGTSGGGAAIDVDAHEFAFEPNEMTASAGEITFRIENTGAVEHDLHWSVNGQDMTSPLVQPGQTETWTITIDQPGTYEGWCTVPGHREAGMTATLTVN